jgi:hypothetical protein
MRIYLENLIDSTSHARLFGLNLLFSGSSMIAGIFEFIEAYLPLFAGAGLMAVAQVMKMYREHKTWLSDERRKDDIHQKNMNQ